MVAYAGDSARSTLVPPVRLEGNHSTLTLESTLRELPLYDFQAEGEHLGTEIAQMFERYAFLPGVIVTEQGRFTGVISRQCFLESLLRPLGTEVLLNQPIRVLQGYTQQRPLLFPANLSILMAGQYGFRRSSDRFNDVIVVELEPGSYYLLDVRDLHIACWQIRGIEMQVKLERLQVEMLQSQKMASLGRLVDGIAHEILDPVSFIWGNLSHVSDYSQDLLRLIAAYEQNLSPASLNGLKEDIELDYLKDDLPKTLESIKTGADRLSKLANSLQNFCHIDEVYPRPADLHDCLDSVLLLLKSRISGEIEIVRNYGHLPPIPCFIGQLSQVFINILGRSIDSLLTQAANQKFQSPIVPPTAAPAPKITITTDICSIDKSGARWASVQIVDTGMEVSKETQNQLLQAFAIEEADLMAMPKETSFTMSYRIITARHGGKFRLYSCIDPSDRQRTGTAFEVLLPLN
jgi:hypothetical protein